MTTKTDEQELADFYVWGKTAPVITPFSAWKARAALQSQDREDAERLDWLDATNAPFKMGWRFGIAPAGNVHPYTVVQLYGKPTTVREAIDHARRIEETK